jgi:predicted O-linked N-acetylglucosamine transferase (SPINDLY family)
LINHDRNKFNVKLFYSGPDDGSDELGEFKNIGDAYFNITEMSDEKASGLMTKENIDIMVDLTGFTQNSRSFIAALRPATQHINWLGYPGTMGGLDKRPLYDFILADKYIIPKSKKSEYAEKVIYLEGCYQPNISSRPILRAVKKSDYDFKENDFIFASFGQSLKITKEMFSLWMGLMQKVPNSVLWLLTSNKTCENNLKNFAKNEFGIQSERINFARKVSFDAHIQRHQIIDLFLDTFPYNAHTSASDALWAGCPIISVSGETFASRVAGSILTEIGCSELVVSSFEEYEKKAIELASQPDKIISLKRKILDLNKTSNLFKPKKFTLDLESKMIDLMN